MAKVENSKELIYRLKKECNIESLVIVGFHEGGKLRWCCDMFSEVIANEPINDYYRNANNKYGEKDNLILLNKSSPDAISHVLPDLEQPSIFYLDDFSHKEHITETDKPCSLIAELRAIKDSEYENIIIIDDKEKFISPPAPSYSVEDWPSLDEVVGEIMSSSVDYYITVVCGDIVAVPRKHKDVLITYYRDTYDSRGPITKGLDSIWRGILQKLAHPYFVMVLDRIGLKETSIKVFNIFR